ncbi:putative protein phosphatase 2C 33 [Forsythia ovata]|uniref:Uncharacterized protein n=1 Tax=Forsythia ovata TaxID=205694 RepID=A0ABD1R1B7_9LAMI
MLVESAARAWRSKYPTSKVDDCAVVCLFLDSNPNDSTAPSTEFKENIASEEQDDTDNKDDPFSPTGLDRSGTVRTSEWADGGESEETSGANEEVALDNEGKNMEIGKEWSALEGVSRVNTLLTLPRFVPNKDDNKAAGERG